MWPVSSDQQNENIMIPKSQIGSRQNVAHHVANQIACDGRAPCWPRVDVAWTWLVSAATARLPVCERSRRVSYHACWLVRPEPGRRNFRWEGGQPPYGKLITRACVPQRPLASRIGESTGRTRRGDRVSTPAVGVKRGMACCGGSPRLPLVDNTAQIPKLLGHARPRPSLPALRGSLIIP